MRKLSTIYRAFCSMLDSAYNTLKRVSILLVIIILACLLASKALEIAIAWEFICTEQKCNSFLSELGSFAEDVRQLWRFFEPERIPTS